MEHIHVYDGTQQTVHIITDKIIVLNCNKHANYMYLSFEIRLQYNVQLQIDQRKAHKGNTTHMAPYLTLSTKYIYSYFLYILIDFS